MTPARETALHGMIVLILALVSSALVVFGSGMWSGETMAGRFGAMKPATAQAWLEEEGPGGALAQAWQPRNGTGYGPLGAMGFIADAALGFQHVRIFNVLAHVLAVLMLFLGLRRAAGEPLKAMAAAVLFAVHPLAVQGVITLEGLPVVMGAAFGFAALWAGPGVAGMKQRVAASLLTACAVLSTPLLGFWPLVLWGAAKWRPEQSGKTKPARWFYPALLAGSMVLALLYAPATGALGEGLVRERFIGLLLPAMRFVQRVFAPVNLGPVYTPDPPQASQYISLAIVLAALGWSLYEWRRLGFWRTGWTWYFAALGPALFALLAQSLNEVNWLVYPALPGLLLITVWGAGALARRWNVPPKALAALACVTLVLSIVAVRAEARSWSGQDAFFQRAMATAPYSAEVQAGYGVALARQGRYEEALDYLIAGTVAEPESWEPYGALGQAYMAAGQYNAAVKAFREGLERNPRVPALHKALGMAFLMLERWADVETTLLPAFGGQPKDPEVCLALARAIAGQGRTGEARDLARRALELAPGYEQAQTLIDSLPPAE